MKLPDNQPTPAQAQLDTAHDDNERPLRLDRHALRLDPPVVRFEDDRSMGSAIR